MHIEPSRTALALIDLQHSNMARTLAPHSSQQVLENCNRLAEALRKAGGTVVFVRVLVDELLRLPADISLARDPAAPPPPPQASELVEQAGRQHGDLLIAKRQWGAFHGTELDQQLRRRGIQTVIMGGIATNFGVESTARAAFDHGYELVFAHDAMSSVKTEMHQFAIQNVFPFIGHVRSTAEVMAEL